MFVKNVSPTVIAKTLNMKPKEVKQHIEDFKASARGVDSFKDLAEEQVAKVREHYSQLIRKGWEVIDDIDRADAEASAGSEEAARFTGHQYIAQKLKAIQIVAQLEKELVDIYQKAGLLDASEMGDEYAEMEEQVEIMRDILAHDLCASCKVKVRRKWAERNGQEVVVMGA